ncbi:MAG TPA: serine/threonine-protein kinase [Pirellulaceae bacterium]|nr:serine/threonine-protein kinase [Pirellulaceae bacterium]
MSDVRSCGHCGVMLPDDSPSGVCPSCLMRLGLGARDAAGTQSHQAGRQPFVPPKPHELSVHFPQLEILDLIGQGGMGAVYKARQVGLDRIVALKILPPHTGDDGSFAERFEREARSLARLNHPNIIGVFDSGRAGDFYYFVMEFVDGINLREAIRAQKLTPAEALAIVPQICDALQYAHDEGIVHRDIKPENVLIDKKGNTKIADFGLARLLGPTADLTLTGTHQVMGTLRYMAPEQMEGSHEVDHRADIYSLGVVFYEMLTGELPMGRFDGPSKKVQVDVRLDEVVFRTLEKEPDRRYQHASDIKDDVQTICGHDGALSGTRRAMSYEFKSKTHLFGWPLLHIAFGRDLRTGKILRAKGIIAIGDIAYGVVAIGSYAVGGIAIGGGAVGGLAFGGGAVGSLAIGGCALGLFSFGGIAMGLLLAIGGLALGLGFSYGGLALGTVAKGPVALGWYADAGHGMAFGVHALGSNVTHQDTPAESFFTYFATLGAGTILVGIMLVAIVTCVAGLLVSFRILRRKKERRAVEMPPNMEPATRRSNLGIVVAVLLIGGFAVMCILPMAFLGWSYVSIRQDFGGVPSRDALIVTSSTSDEMTSRTIKGPMMPPRYGAAEQVNSMDKTGWIIWTQDGPTLHPTVRFEGDRLTTEQRTNVNQVLSEAHQAYVKLEQENIHQAKNEAGHWVTTVMVQDESKLAELEDQVWTKIDAIVNVSWQNLMRLNLGLKSPDDAAILGFEGGHGAIEIWKVGSWYHWKVAPIKTRSASNARPNATAPPNDHVQGPKNSGPHLPIRYQRFWN